MSTILRSCSGALLVAGALLVPRLALAQQTPAITPDDSVSVPMGRATEPLVPTSVSSAPAVAPRPIIENLEFSDIEISKLLSVIAGAYPTQISIVVSGDVTGKIGYINLSNKTPEQAISAVATNANLQVVRSPDGTFLIGKTLAADAPRQAITPTFLPSTIGALPTLNSSATPNFTANGGITQTMPSSPALSQWGAGGDVSLVPPNNDDLRLVKPADDTQKSTYQLRLRNVKPSLMAYWLDPANHPTPPEIVAMGDGTTAYNKPALVSGIINPTSPIGGPIMGSAMNTQGVVPSQAINPYLNENSDIETRSNAQFGGGGFGGGGGGFGGGGGGFGGGGNNNRGGNNRGGRGGAGGGVFQLPQGVDRIVAVDPANALLVFGTPEGVGELRRTIAFLDRPLRQVEIEAQFVTLSTSDLTAFGVDFTSARGNFNANTQSLQPGIPSSGGFQLGFVRGNFQAALTAVQNTNRVKVLSAPRITAINNLTATINQSFNQPIQFTTSIVNQNQTQTTTSTNTTIVYISSNISLSVTPTINNDGTVTVYMFPNVSSSVPTANSIAPTVTRQSIQTIANVRDGETIALGGLKTKTITVGRSRVPVLGNIPILGKFFTSRSNSENEQELIIFLTARILHRAGEDTNIPGT